MTVPRAVILEFVFTQFTNIMFFCGPYCPYLGSCPATPASSTKPSWLGDGTHRANCSLPLLARISGQPLCASTPSRALGEPCHCLRTAFGSLSPAGRARGLELWATFNGLWATFNELCAAVGCFGLPCRASWLSRKIFLRLVSRESWALLPPVRHVTEEVGRANPGRWPPHHTVSSLDEPK